MTPTSIIQLAKKHGALGVLAAWLAYTNMRLDAVEGELYKCYDKFTPKIQAITERFESSPIRYAILTKETTLKRRKQA
jgi:hypothetical protein